MRLKAGSFGTILFLSSGLAYADDRCAAYVGNTVKPETFEEVISTLGNTAPKGEFETTADYQKRLASAKSSGSRIISKEVEDPKFFEYDADANRLRIKIYAFSNKNMEYGDAFRVVKSNIKASSTSIETVISRKEVTLGTSEAQNGFGAHFTVTHVNVTTEAIFDRDANLVRAPVGFTYEKLFPVDPKGYMGQLSIYPPEAKKLKPTLRIALVVEPKAPFAIEGEHQFGVVSIENPREATKKFRIIVANIQCGLLMDDTNKVLASYASTPPSR